MEDDKSDDFDDPQIVEDEDIDFEYKPDDELVHSSGSPYRTDSAVPYTSVSQDDVKK